MSNNKINTKINSNVNGDVLSKNHLNKNDSKSVICDICYNFDDFSFCGNCFNKFNSKILRYKANTKKDNIELNNAIKEYIEKRKIEIENFNKISSIKSNIENLKKLIKTSKNRINKNIQNLEILKTQKKSIEDKMKNFEENISTLNNSINLNKKNNQSISEIIQKRLSEKNVSIKNFFKKLLNLIFCGNNIFLFSEIFEKDEYVLPTLDKEHNSKKKFFDDFSNVLSTEIKSFENFSIEEHKKPENFEKLLKIKESIINYNMNPFPYLNDKNLNESEKDFYNNIYVCEINNYVHKIILFTKIAAKFLNIKLPCNIESDCEMEISDNFDFSAERKKLNIADDYLKFNESSTFSSLLALDKNLNFIKDIIGVKAKKPNFITGYFNANNYSEKNNFELLNFEQNNFIAANNNFNSNRGNFDQKRRNNSLSINLNKNNAQNSPSFSYNIVNNKTNITSLNNVEFNSDFLNMIPFFIFCGENFDVKKFSKNCDSIKKQATVSVHQEKNNIIKYNNNSESNKNLNEKSDKSNVDEKTYEILLDKNLDKSKIKNNNNLEREDINNDNYDIEFENVELTDEIYKNIKREIYKDNYEKEKIGFMIIENYFDDKN